jgi:hypothetical protein
MEIFPLHFYFIQVIIIFHVSVFVLGDTDFFYMAMDFIGLVMVGLIIRDLSWFNQ